MIFELKFAKVATDVWEALNQIPRTGWVRRGVKDSESVQAHIISCRELVIDLIDGQTEFSMSDILEILNILEVHDYPEKINGDEVIVTYDPIEKKKLKAEKFIREYNAMYELTKNLGDVGKGMFNLWLRFEKENDRLSSFAKQIDKYQSIEKAFEYQQKGEKVRAQDFIDYYKDDITHPLLKEKMLKIEKRAKDTCI
jgi:5'-deoxynucleotidase YfbR-like HD superfamily hydrolase